jgi:hypothetical protein
LIYGQCILEHSGEFVLRTESVVYADNNAVHSVCDGSTERIFGVKVTRNESASVCIYPNGTGRSL